MKKRNKSYLLFLYGNWIDERDIIRALQETLIVVIGSGYLKFVHGPGSAIVCFKSQESFEAHEEIWSSCESKKKESLQKYLESNART